MENANAESSELDAAPVFRPMRRAEQRTTQEEVAELQATIAELQATIAQMQQDYDAVRRNRDMWVTKYNALEAEYEQYKRDHPDTDGGDE